MKRGDIPDRLSEALYDQRSEDKESLERIWRLAEGADLEPQIAPDTIQVAWQELAHATRISDVRRDRTPSRRSTRFRLPYARVWLPVTALVSGLALFFWFQPVIEEAPRGEQLSVVLPDRSQIELNSGSRIRYPRFFSWSRTVHLEGEAFFDVETADVPFVVSTFNAEVRVLGTSFNVRAWEESMQPVSVITLNSGSLELAARAYRSARFVMEPGQTRVVGGRRSAASPPVSPPDTSTFAFAMAWRDGDLVFKDQSFGVVLEDIERRFDLDLVLRAHQFADKKVTFSFRRPEAVEEVIESLCMALGMQYRATVTGYEIYRP